MIVRPKQAKEVLSKCHGLNKKQYRDSFRSLEHLKTFLNTDGNAKMSIRWRNRYDMYLDLEDDDTNNKYFGGYQVCATGLKNFVAAVGIPMYSFDACFSKHTYYKGVYGNFVTLIDTKPGSFTNIPVAVTTEETEQQSLYDGLFNVSGCNVANSELLQRMKEQVSYVIGDGSKAFFNAVQDALGYRKKIATCSFHIKESARRKCRQLDTKWYENLFWQLQGARSQMERNRAWEKIQQHFSSASVKQFLTDELRKDESDLFNDRPWTRHSHLRAGICPFGRKGTNNPVEQVNATQVEQRHFEPYRF